MSGIGNQQYLGIVTPANLSVGAPTWDQNGNFGIGTSSPSTYGKLAVVGNVAAPVVIGIDNASASTSAGGKLQFSYQGSSTGYILNQFDGGDFNTTYQANKGHIWLGASGTERMRIDSAGNVGIGASSPTSQMTIGNGTVQSNIDINSAHTGYNGPNITGYVAGTREWIIGSRANVEGSGATGLSLWVQGANPFAVYTNGGERMRIDASGNVAIGNTASTTQKLGVFATSTSALAYNLFLQNTGAAGNIGQGVQLSFSNDVGGSPSSPSGYIRTYNISGGTNQSAMVFGGYTGSAVTEFFRFDNGRFNVGIGASVLANQGAISAASSTLDLFDGYNGTTQKFAVANNGTIYAVVTSIQSVSDIRWKENIRDLDSGLADVMALKPRLYDWKEGKGADIKNARGFIAQEFEEVFPDLVGDWREPAPEGEEPYKSIRQDLMPTLVKAIQEQQSLIQDLTTRLAALEAK
jgi:Chaperone of endosialidase